MTTYPDDPVHPIIPPVDETGRIAVGFPDIDGGMTKREYMALHILAGMMAMDSRTSNMAEQAQIAVRRTDALIAALNGESDDAG